MSELTKLAIGTGERILLANPPGRQRGMIQGVAEPPHHPKGDLKGPHTTPLLTRPYKDTEILRRQYLKGQTNER